MELTDDRLNEIIGCVKYHQRAPQYGARAWVAEGLHVDVVYWDAGNGWCDIMQVITKREEEENAISFFKEAEKYLGE